jgi:hypothetical protein
MHSCVFLLNYNRSLKMVSAFLRGLDGASLLRCNKGYRVWRAGELASWRAGELASWRAGELASWRAGAYAARCE